jgi:hypothetical protein
MNGQLIMNSTRAWLVADESVRRSISDLMAPLDRLSFSSARLKDYAFVAALQTILAEYRQFIAHAAICNKSNPVEIIRLHK